MSSPLISVAEQTILAVPAPGQRGREFKVVSHQPVTMDTRGRKLSQGNVHVPSIDTEAATRQVGRANTEPQEGKQAAPGAQWLSHPWNSHLILGLLAQTPPGSPPTWPCPSLTCCLWDNICLQLQGERRDERRWLVQRQVKEGTSSHPASTEARETEKSPCAIPFLLLPAPCGRQPKQLSLLPAAS